ncbi:uncharacterized protein J3D65DRAFT_388739 [Phyllosticta citribraziliensis]|uniref:Uncharacterized protein n=1 Tax=Phyllosticta citribraziliensis TaxID=989973 RepID=A0ABR1LKN9_9PEZI
METAGDEWKGKVRKIASGSVVVDKQHHHRQRPVSHPPIHSSDMISNAVAALSAPSTPCHALPNHLGFTLPSAQASECASQATPCLSAPPAITHSHAIPATGAVRPPLAFSSFVNFAPLTGAQRRPNQLPSVDRNRAGSKSSSSSSSSSKPRNRGNEARSTDRRPDAECPDWSPAWLIALSGRAEKQERELARLVGGWMYVNSATEPPTRPLTSCCCPLPRSTRSGEEDTTMTGPVQQTSHAMPLLMHSVACVLPSRPWISIASLETHTPVRHHHHR